MSSGLVCSICDKHTFQCTCDTSWNYFDNKINECSGRTVNDTQYTSLNVNTMTICFNFNQFIDLRKLYDGLPASLVMKYNPGTKKSKIKKKKGSDSFYNSLDIKITIKDHSKGVYSNVSIFFFPNGKGKLAGIKTINTISSAIDETLELIKYVSGTTESPETLGIENVKIQMICTDFKIKPVKTDLDGWCIKQEDLKNILVKEGYSATFNTLSRYPGINMKVNSIIEESKQISLFIFRSGSIIITGAKNADDLVNCYKIITAIIAKNNKQLFYYDINEEIKQKKKNKKKSESA